MKVGIFGGTFDPFTEAHKNIVDRLLDLKLVDKVLIVPTIVTYHRNDKVRWLSDSQRIWVIEEMLRNDPNFERIGSPCNRKIEIWKDEYSLKSQCAGSELLMSEFIGKRRYVHTLVDIVRKMEKDSYSKNEYYTVIGEDSFNAFTTWYDYKTILDLSKLIVFTGRTGIEAKESEIPSDKVVLVKMEEAFAGLSSTEIRRKYRELDDGMKKYVANFQMKEKANYGFSAEKAFKEIKEHWTRFAEAYRFKKFILGISGGKDSTVVAGLAARIFGNDNVYGVMMPNHTQSDIIDSENVIKSTGINRIMCNIGSACNDILQVVRYTGYGTLTEDTEINLPPRVRTTCLYALGQTLNAIPLCCDNLTERVCGYSTLWGDNIGSYAPIKNLTVTEVVALGDYLGLPSELVHKKPSDGLQEQGDEERMGIKYAELDRKIRGLEEGSDDLKAKVEERFQKNRFKLEMARIPGPDFKELPNTFRDRCYMRDIF